MNTTKTAKHSGTSNASPGHHLSILLPAEATSTRTHCCCASQGRRMVQWVDARGPWSNNSRQATVQPPPLALALTLVHTTLSYLDLEDPLHPQAINGLFELLQELVL